MSLKISNSTMNHVGTVVSTTHDDKSAYEFDQCHFVNVEKLFEMRDAPGLYARIGLPPDMPVEHFQQALEVLAASHGLPLQQRVEQLRGSKLESLLSTGANLTTIVGNILSVIPSLS